jgi:hypothetical protein
MLNFYRNSFIIFLLCILPLEAGAVYLIKHDDVNITLCNDNPCFSFPSEKNGKNDEYFFDSLEVYLQNPVRSAWKIYKPDLNWKGSINPIGE